MTNEEWIKQLSTRELAELLGRDNCCDCCIQCEETPKDCIIYIVEWLKQEHKED